MNSTDRSPASGEANRVVDGAPSTHDVEQSGTAMTAALFVLLGAVVVALIVVVLRTSRRHPATGASVAASSPWFDRARAVLDQADRLIAHTGTIPGDPLDAADTEALGSVSEELAALSSDVAALSATAPTPMDARVSRSLGTRTQMLRDAYDRELRRREVFVHDPGLSQPAPDVDQIIDRIREFELAVEDLRTHVELL